MANVLEEAFSNQNSASVTSSQDLSEQEAVQLSVIVPMYNQEKNAHASLIRLKEVLNSMMLSYEIVVVNDGSTDETLTILQREAAMDDRIRVISYPENMGKGYAVKTGIIKSRGHIVLFTDGDLDISPYIILDYIHELQNNDLLIASKRHPLSKIRAPVSRRFLSRAFNLFVMIGTGIKLKDTQSGLKAGKGSTMRTIFRAVTVKRYAFDVELLTIATLLRLCVREMPIEITLDRRFKVKEIIRMLIDVLAISYRLRIRKSYQKKLLTF